MSCSSPCETFLYIPYNTCILVGMPDPEVHYLAAICVKPPKYLRGEGSFWYPLSLSCPSPLYNQLGPLALNGRLGHLFLNFSYLCIVRKSNITLSRYYRYISRKTFRCLFLNVRCYLEMYVLIATIRGKSFWVSPPRNHTLEPSLPLCCFKLSQAVLQSFSQPPLLSWRCQLWLCQHCDHSYHFLWECWYFWLHVVLVNFAYWSARHWRLCIYWDKCLDVQSGKLVIWNQDN